MRAVELAGATRVGAIGAGATDAVVVDPAAGIALVADAIGDDREDLAGVACREYHRAATAGDAGDRVAAGLAAAEAAVAARRGRVAMAVVAREHGELAIAHAGAVRIYVLRPPGGPPLESVAPRWAPSVQLASGATFAAVTRDHGSVAAMVEVGLITREAGRAHPLRSRLTRALGAGLRPERRRFAPAAGDRLLLVSNGLWEVLDDPVLAGHLAAAPDPRAACDALLDALHRVGRDHAGVAAVFVEHDGTGRRAPAPPVASAPTEGTPTLDRFGRDLTAAARSGRLDPVSGRDAELTRLQLALLSRRKPNAILVGEPGVGKTSLVEALALATVAGALPRELADLRIVEIAASTLVGGAKLRGELEDRVNRLIEEAEAQAPRLVVFFDEIHVLLGAPGGGISVADALKPALARGALRTIGATTPVELERLAQDEALLRRFEIIRIDEPTPAAARTMLATARPGLERHFGAAFLDEALDAAIELTIRHVP
ncbi:MAG TPA: AAA family ATPase, partial [Kofleriaceae bacterium]|nr:AAA family ATPase [Kofleriaceae bacterium]